MRDLPSPRQQRPACLRIPRVARDDVDHAVDGVRAPQRRAGPADHLDAVDVGEDIVLHVPENAGEERRIDRPPVDHHEELVGDVRVEAAWEMAHVPLLKRATWTPSASASASAMVVAPARRMSSPVMTEMAAAWCQLAAVAGMWS